MTLSIDFFMFSCEKIKKKWKSDLFTIVKKNSFWTGQIIRISIFCDCFIVFFHFRGHRRWIWIYFWPGVLTPINAQWTPMNVELTQISTKLALTRSKCLTRPVKVFTGPVKKLTRPVNFLTGPVIQAKNISISTSRAPENEKKTKNTLRFWFFDRFRMIFWRI